MKDVFGCQREIYNIEKIGSESRKNWRIEAIERESSDEKRERTGKRERELERERFG